MVLAFIFFSYSLVKGLATMALQLSPKHHFFFHILHYHEPINLRNLAQSIFSITYKYVHRSGKMCIQS